MPPLHSSRLSGHLGEGAAFKWLVVILSVVWLPLEQLGVSLQSCSVRGLERGIVGNSSCQAPAWSPCFMLLPGAQSFCPDLREICTWWKELVNSRMMAAAPLSALHGEAGGG